MYDDEWSPARQKVAIMAMVAVVAAYLVVLLQQRDLLPAAMVSGGGMLVLVVSASSGHLSRLGRLLAAAPVTSVVALGLATFGIVSLCREDHFALLLVSSTLVMATAALGIDLHLERGELHNLGGAASMAFGGYATAWIVQYAAMDQGVALLVATLFGGVASTLLLSAVAVQGQWAAAVTTLALGYGLERLAATIPALGGARGLRLPPLMLGGWDLGYGFTFAGQSMSRFGVHALLALAGLLAVLALRTWTAQSRTGALFVGGMALSLAGGLAALTSGVAAPHLFMITESIMLAGIVAMGRPGNAAGVITTALAFTLLVGKLQFLQEFRLLLLAVGVTLVVRARSARQARHYPAGRQHPR